MKTILILTLTHIAAFAFGGAFAHILWAKAIAKGKEELAKTEAKLKSIFDPSKPPINPP